MLGIILDIGFDEMSADMGSHGWYRNRKLIALLGWNYEAILPYLGQLPQDADFATRRDFLANLWAALAKDGDSVKDKLENLRLYGNEPF